jgi:hypothetical protein
MVQNARVEQRGSLGRGVREGDGRSPPTRRLVMAGAASGRFDEPDEERALGRGKAQILHLAGATVGRSTMEPGWRWSEDVKPIVGGESCQAHHVGYVLSGSLHLVTDGGEEFDVSAGDAYEVMPGHDAWVTGDDPYEALEFQSQTAESYAKPSE